MSIDTAPAADQVDLRGYLRVLRRRWLLVTATTVLVAGVALGASLVETPLYRSSATVAVEPPVMTSEPGGLAISDQEIETQLQVLMSQEVAARAADDLGLGLGAGALLGKVGAARVPDSRVIQVAAVDADPRRAADIAQAFAEAYLAERRADALDRVLEASAALQDRTALVRERLAEVEAQITRSGQTTTLVEERRALDDQLSQLTAQLTVLDATDSFVRGGGEIIRSAGVPGAPTSPQPVRSGALGLVAGLALGIALAFVRDRFDDAVRTDHDVTHALDGSPVLGHVPVLEDTSSSAVELLARPDSLAAEALRTLRTNVRFAVGRSTLRSLLVTSPGEGEGKSTLAVNLAVAAATAGQRVLLVDADMRRPAIHRQFGVPNGMGTSSVLTGEVDARDVLVDVGVANLALMTAGRRPPNPAELLADGMAHLLADAVGQVDLLVVDGPPVLAVADSLEVGRVVEATLLVVAHGLTGRRALGEAGHRLQLVGGNLIGSVINVSPPELDHYGYYYGPAIDPDRRGRRRRRSSPLDAEDQAEPQRII